MKTKELIQSQVMKQRRTPSTFFNKLVDRKSVRVLLCLLFLTAIGIISSRTVSALERPTAEEIEQYKRDGTLSERAAYAQALGNHLASPSFAKRSHYKLRELSLQLEGYTASEIAEILAPPPAWEGMPTTGSVKILALLIAFNDFSFSNSASSINSKLFGSGAGGYPLESLHNYYDRSSYNQLNILGNTLGWYTTPYPRSSVSQTYSGRENLIKEVLNHYDSSGHDFTQYDNDGDGVIDYFVVIWTGWDTGWATFWWGYMTHFSDSSFTVDGKTLDVYSWQWEARPWPGTFSPQVVIHETGHALGLPDLYDYDDSVGPRGGVGRLDMMDGTWGDHNCFSKFVLDWIAPTTISSGSQTVTMNASGSSKDAVVVMPGITSGDQFDELFMVQNRYRVNNDTAYPNDGLLIWHIDSSLDGSGYNYLYNNSYTDHKLVRLMEADGLEEIEMNFWADAGDYYTAGDIFGPSTFPNSNRYDGTSTGIKVENIVASGSVMTATISILGSDGTDRDLVFTPVTPCRIVDTRLAGGAIPPGGIRSYNVWGAVAIQGGNPAGCPSPQGEPRAVHINVTAVPSSGNGYLTAYPFGSTAPLASLVNYMGGGQPFANSGTVKTCFSCARDISVKSGAGTTHVVIDVTGYYFAKP
jgi:M6 family metalloprotease-like protein